MAQSVIICPPTYRTADVTTGSRRLEAPRSVGGGLVEGGEKRAHLGECVEVVDAAILGTLVVAAVGFVVATCGRLGLTDRPAGPDAVAVPDDLTSGR